MSFVPSQLRMSFAPSEADCFAPYHVFETVEVRSTRSRSSR